MATAGPVAAQLPRLSILQQAGLVVLTGDPVSDLHPPVELTCRPNDQRNGLVRVAGSSLTMALLLQVARLFRFPSDGSSRRAETDRKRSEFHTSDSWAVGAAGQSP